MGTVADDWKRLGALIRKRRKSLGMTQVELGDVSGLGRSTVQKLESATGSPEPKTVKMIETALGWREGSFAAILAGREPLIASQPPVAAPEDEYTNRRPGSTAPDMVTVLDHIVFDLAVHMAPDMPLAEVRELQARALETARRLGLPLPPYRPAAHSNDDPES